jgi:hypothetical protein
MFNLFLPESYMTIDCTWNEFKRMAKEFHHAAPSLNLEELDNAWKCLSLAYFGMNEPMWASSAAALLKIEARVFSEREFQLEMQSISD